MDRPFSAIGSLRTLLVMASRRALVDQLCREAATTFGLRTIRSATSDANIGSQRVLLEAGFVLIGRADPLTSAESPAAGTNGSSCLTPFHQGR
jgi:hypothetical protein